MPAVEFAAIAISRKPACETDEYASSRFTSRWAIAAKLPIASEQTASTATATDQISACSGNAVTRIRSMSTRPAIFVAADMKAVTVVGAPWYTSGVHMWNGAAETLNASPARIIAIPVTKSGSSAPVASRIAVNPSSPVAP